MISNFTRTHKIVILIIIITIALGFGYNILDKHSKDIEFEENSLFEVNEKDNIGDDLDKNNLNEPLSAEENIPKEVVVHITGEVAKPGIVTLKNGDRVIDAIKKAGGLTAYADEKNINLAQKLFDEDKIMIPSIDENLNLEASDINTQTVVMSKNNESSSDANSGVEVNLNTSSKEQLKTLPGIGDVTADKIIEYRESTPFNTIEDIKNVSGIGDKKFEAIKNMITTR